MQKDDRKRIRRPALNDADPFAADNHPASHDAFVMRGVWLEMLTWGEARHVRKLRVARCSVLADR